MRVSLTTCLVLSLSCALVSAQRFNRSSMARRASPALEIIDPSHQRAFSAPLLPIDPKHIDPKPDMPRFGAPCVFNPSQAFLTCGDWIERSSGTDHALFCSPHNICAGEGAVCGTSEACGTGLDCNLRTHKCALKGSFARTRDELRLEGRRKATGGACPVESEACAWGSSFNCVFTQRDDQECGGCLNAGGIDCSKIEGALATSCRQGSCVVHQCQLGYALASDGTCVDEML